MRQAARQPTLSRVAETSSGEAEEGSRQEHQETKQPEARGREMASDEKKSFSLWKTQAESPWVGVLNSCQSPFTHRHTGKLLVELSPTAASNEDLKKLPVLCCVYSNNESLEEGVRNS